MVRLYIIKGICPVATGMDIRPNAAVSSGRLCRAADGCAELRMAVQSSGRLCRELQPAQDDWAADLQHCNVPAPRSHGSSQPVNPPCRIFIIGVALATPQFQFIPVITPFKVSLNFEQCPENPKRQSKKNR